MRCEIERREPIIERRGEIVPSLKLSGERAGKGSESVSERLNTKGVRS